MIHYKSNEEIELLRLSSLLVGKTLAEVARHIKPGVTTQALDQVAETFIRDHNAIPAFKGYGGFPATLCVSVNDVVVHGIPGDQILQDGDLVSVDCGVILNGFVGDSAYSFPVGEVAEEIRLLMERTKESLYLGIQAATAGKRIGDIGFEIQNYVEQFGYNVVRDLVGHGVGRHLHEKPEVPNYGRRGTGTLLKPGLVICIEPMINLGTRSVIQDKDGWTIRTADGRPSAHYEHAVAIKEGTTEILSSFEEIEKVLESTH
ncbi:MAG: type I methionyl aminopeptidase [Lentimicrobium sp.]|jgi:methionyl aminopeptidase|nr:type I methionyl aminopeptidase [Lentimicrobium sp.]MDD2526576.1 type I methionyl aminopeptidase [Lentimicrobiaceae bacterium]MDD4597285.1 type I methionyl aminopeptidase [Lentimicrobiaceae bacterium]MDY0024590.1 type I methionyl aminopeptidase [Lentimicrobium sp.]HAH56994.1 type I methionyl aminopeptidase [Bacteroidales bacterium]